MRLVGPGGCDRSRAPSTPEGVIHSSGPELALFARTGLGLVCPVTELDVVVTDASAPEEARAALAAAGVEVRVV